jgi:sugar phosphate isomerase/epimerase
MQLGLCLHPKELAGFKSLPCDFIEGHVQKFLLPESADEEFFPHKIEMRDCDLTMPASNCFLPPDLKVTGPAVDLDRLARYTDVAFARAQSIGMTVVVFGSAGARMVPEGWSATKGFEQYVTALKTVAPIAQKHGVTVVVEALNRGECNLVNTIDEGAEATRRCDHKKVRLLVDVFHMLRNGETPDAIERHADLVVHSHVAENQDRAQPGVHGDDFRPFFRALRKADKCQRLTLECVWTGDLYQQAAPALKILRQQLKDAGY